MTILVRFHHISDLRTMTSGEFLYETWIYRPLFPRQPYADDTNGRKKHNWNNQIGFG